MVRKIIESMLSTAANVINPLSSHDPPRAYLDLVDTAYSAVNYGNELYNVNTPQNAGEKEFSYLQHLQTVLNAAVKRVTFLLKLQTSICWNDSEAVAGTSPLLQYVNLEKKGPPTL